MIVLNKNVEQWFEQCPLIKDMIALKPIEWFNTAIAPAKQALNDVALTIDDINDAALRLKRFAPFIAKTFPETAKSEGIIESPLLNLAQMQRILNIESDISLNGQLWLKADNDLPISGSIKARGGIYEVLKHAEDLALAAGLIKLDDDYGCLANPEIKVLFNGRKIAVGSTGNLGLSIGIMSAALGFETYVHMSADAKQWKKDKLRANGVNVIEYKSDYGAAVEQGRKQAASDPTCYFVDDENSRNLFLGYSVAAQRLIRQFQENNIVVDEDHPLFVYLPCGVGGGPGGIAFGLKTYFGDHVHCIFAEPTHSPAMLLGVYTGLHDGVSVQDFGIDNITAADGLAVGRPSGFVGRVMQRLIDGYYTVEDKTLYHDLAKIYDVEGIKLEPSAAAGMGGYRRVIQNAAYLKRMNIKDEHLNHATHLVWATGGAMVPDHEFKNYLKTAGKLVQ